MSHLYLAVDIVKKPRPAAVDNSFAFNGHILDSFSPEDAFSALISINVSRSDDYRTLSEIDIDTVSELDRSGQIAPDAELESAATLLSDKVQSLLDRGGVVGGTVATDSEEGRLVNRLFVLSDPRKRYQKQGNYGEYLFHFFLMFLVSLLMICFLPLGAVS